MGRSDPPLTAFEQSMARFGLAVTPPEPTAERRFFTCYVCGTLSDELPAGTQPSDWSTWLERFCWDVVDRPGANLRCHACAAWGYAPIQRVEPSAWRATAAGARGSSGRSNG